MKKKLLKTGVNDKVIMAYSGHGLLDDKKDYYLSTYAVDFRNPKEKGLPYDELENILDSIPARKKLLLIDACHSGEIDKEEMIHQTKISLSEKAKLTKAEKKKAKIEKGGETPENKSPGIRLRDRIELMQSLFVNVAKNTGSTIFTASTGLESAYESNELLHSFFTYYMLEAMKKNTSMKVSKLKEFIFENVEKASNKTQRPTSRSETIAVDWVLW
ncbi:caspase domain-containing protein [Pseudarcicella hirudinis]|uniref:caspase family protein n=1 Tax=Pseudarcicella hirudinis TaxID=1079859 RepID=UPI0035E80E44